MARVDQLGRKSLVFLLGFSLYGSLNPWGRPEIAGFLFHPYFVVLAVLVVLSGIRSIDRLPRRFGMAFGIYVALFTLLSLQGGLHYIEPVKIFLTFFTIVGIVMTIRDRSEVELVTAGAALAVGLVGVPTLINPATSVVGADELVDTFGNKNSYSLYALPIILLVTHLAMDPRVSRRLRTVMVVGAGLSSIAILSSGNRSGYLGLAIIGLLTMIRRRRLRDAVLVAVAGSVVFLLLSTLGSTAAFWYRLSNPENSQRSDAVRIDILAHATRIGLDSPVIGVGPPNVAQNIAVSVGHGSGAIVIGKLDAHNLFAYNFAGGGFPLLLSLFGVMAVLMMRPPEWSSGTPPSEQAAMVLRTLQSAVILLAIRGWFSEDALTTPGFPMVFGLLIVLLRAETDEAITSGASMSEEPEEREPAHVDLFARERARRAARI